MSTHMTLDSAGRLLIPKRLRSELHLLPGDSVVLEREGDSIVVRPDRPKGRMVREHGMWVFHGEPAEDIAVDLVEQMREARNRQILGLDGE